MMGKPVNVAFTNDGLDTLAGDLKSAGGDLDTFAADAVQAGNKAESALTGVGDKADAVGSATSQAAGGLGDLGGALSLMPGPLGAVGGGMEALAPAVMGVTGAADLLNLATTKFPALAKAQEIATQGVAVAQRALNAVMAGNPIALVVLAIVALIAIFATLYAKNESFRELVNKVWSALKDGAETVKEKLTEFGGAVKDKLDAAGDRFSDLRTAAQNAIGSYSDGGGGVLGKVHGIVSAVTGLPGTIREKAAGVFDPIQNAAGDAIGTYSDKGGGALGKLYDVVTAVTGIGGTVTQKAAGMWNGISSSFKGVINDMIGWWNNLSFSVDIPDKIPGLPDSFTISTPNIPFLASGGIVTRATLAVVGEAGPEAVIPLDKLGQVGGGNVQVFVQVAPTADRAAIGQEIQHALDDYYRAGGRPMGY